MAIREKDSNGVTASVVAVRIPYLSQERSLERMGAYEVSF